MPLKLTCTSNASYEDTLQDFATLLLSNCSLLAASIATAALLSGESFITVEHVMTHFLIRILWRWYGALMPGGVWEPLSARKLFPEALHAIAGSPQSSAGMRQHSKEETALCSINPKSC